MASWAWLPPKVMWDTSNYLVYVVNVRSRKDGSRRSYVSFGDVCSEIEFIEACSGKLVISLRKVYIMRIKIEDIKKTCWGWCG